MNNEIDLMQYGLSLFVRCLGQLMTNDCCCDFTDLTNADDRSGGQEWYGCDGKCRGGDVEKGMQWRGGDALIGDSFRITGGIL